GFSAYGSGGYQKTVIDKLIPVSMEQFVNVKSDSFKPTFPPGALDHPVMQIGETAAENEVIWKQKFPLLYGFNYVDHAKPGATVLAQHPTQQNQFGPMVILAVQEVGKGRTMAFTSDTTIGWGADFETLWGEPRNGSGPVSSGNCDSRYYRSFWINAVRWLAAGRAAQHHNAVLLQLAKTYCRPDEAVTSTVNLRLPAGANPKNTIVSLMIMGDGTATQSVPAKYDATTGQWLAQLQPPVGNFVVTATAMAAGTLLGDDKQMLVCEETDRETSDVRAAPELMNRIAEISGGQPLTADAAGRQKLLSNLKPQSPNMVEYRRTPVWSRWPYLALALGLLTIEWITRRTRNLA
ncbi:MAG: hypothetical protein JWO95_3356, partial [Verrucomicrobiales bacterium]|nr:hypothetical protein [Verrucomicrobiales bacterium]